MALPSYQISRKSTKWVKKIYTHDLYLQPAMPLGRICPTVKKLALVAMVISQSLCRFCLTVNYMQWLPQ
jgi:hypothetical protein